MKSITFSVCLCICLFYVHADVSEIVNKSEIQTCLVLTNHEDTTTADSSSQEESISAEAQTSQLNETHPDFQGPYHYREPEVKLEYAVPVVSPPEGRDLAVGYLPPPPAPVVTEVPPEGRTEEVPNKEYLPPQAVEVEAKLKRNVHFGRKLL